LSDGRLCVGGAEIGAGDIAAQLGQARLQGMLDLVDRADYRALAANGLHEFCDDIQARLADLNVVIGQTYFRAAHPQKMAQSLFSLV